MDEQEYPPELAALMDGMIDTSDAYRVMSLHEAQVEISRRVRNEFPNLSGNARGPYIQGGMAYFQKYHHLDDWNPKSRAGKSVAGEIARIDREARQARAQAIKAAGFKPRYASKAEVKHVMRSAHDACMTDTQPSASALLRDAGVPAKEATRLASKRSIHTASAWEELENHPARVAMREHKVTSRRKERGATGGSLAGTVAALYSLAEHTKDRERISSLEAARTTIEEKQDAMQAEINALKAQLAAQATRNALDDAGVDPKAEAQRMRKEGMSIGDISKAVGRSKSTVHSWCSSTESAI